LTFSRFHFHNHRLRPTLYLSVIRGDCSFQCVVPRFFRLQWTRDHVQSASANRFIRKHRPGSPQPKPRFRIPLFGRRSRLHAANSRDLWDRFPRCGFCGCPSTTGRSNRSLVFRLAIRSHYERLQNLGYSVLWSQFVYRACAGE
jgi:hypothetical protein